MPARNAAIPEPEGPRGAGPGRGGADDVGIVSGEVMGVPRRIAQPGREGRAECRLPNEPGGGGSRSVGPEERIIEHPPCRVKGRARLDRVKSLSGRVLEVRRKRPISPTIRVLRSDRMAGLVRRRRGAMSGEAARLEEDGRRERNWKRWGPYLSERQWGTVREDYSADGDCWDYFPHEHAAAAPTAGARTGCSADLRPRVPALLRARAVERPRSDSQGAALRPDRTARAITART